MKLYFAKGACSLASRIIINETKLPCEFESVDLAGKKTESGANFYSINPKGSVPVLITDDNETLTENAVIMQYLANAAHADNLLPAPGSFKHYRVLEWLNFVATELHKGFSPLFNPAMPLDTKEKITIPVLKGKLGYVNTQLEHSEFLTGETFTLPDAYLFVMTSWAGYFKMNLADWPHLSRHFMALRARTAIQKSLDQEGLHF
ncbi:Glutathione S-transferase GST-6.0 [Aquicella siphonis]|uniref:Glutathione S-transferase GST-6.0 n=1 Tax=Aquicella siphonis TaxID=254247 RepID=A0A5E4PLY8_9COXI|nr:glutathione transferase GstA [Aquicella siphonis]VVC77262.1 Glutathione S-transferase GST-6.0 [Aquicella siphonis]